jgi:hypothetical protein
MVPLARQICFNTLAVAMITAVFCGGVGWAQSPQQIEDDWAKELKALEGVQQAIGAEQIKKHKAQPRLVTEHAGQAKDKLPNLSLRVFEPDDIEVRLYRTIEDRPLARLSFKQPQENLTGWQQSTRNGYPSQEYDGGQSDTSRATIWVLYPNYLLVVSCDVFLPMNKRFELKAQPSLKRAGELVDLVHNDLRRAGCLDWDKPAAMGLTFETDEAVPVPVCNLACTFSVNGETKEAMTNQEGWLFAAFNVPDGSKELVVELTGVTLTSKTTYGSAPAFVVNRWTLPFERKFILTQQNDFGAEETFKLPVREVRVKFDVPVGVTASGLAVYTGEYMDYATRAFVIKKFSGNACTFKVPALPPFAGKDTVFGGSGRDKRMRDFTGWQYVTLPRASDAKQEVKIELSEHSWKQFDQIVKPKLEKSFKAAGFTADEIKKILDVTILPTKVEEGEAPKRRWLEGTSTIEMGDTDNLRDNALDLGHELGHHITNVIAKDATPNVGGKHDVVGKQHPELAWDEGRAHFYAWAFTRIVKLKGEYNRQNWTKETEPANRETYVLEGLTDHYGNRKLYPTIEAALGDFRTVQQQAKAAGSLGRPPRTLEEFISVKQKAATGEIAKDLEAMKKRFKLDK